MQNGRYTGPRLNFFTLQDTATGAGQRFLGDAYESGFIDELSLGAAVLYELGANGWCSRVLKAGAESVAAAGGGFAVAPASRAGSPQRVAFFERSKRGYFILRDDNGRRRRFSGKAYLSGAADDLKPGDELRFEMHERGGWCICVARA